MLDATTALLLRHVLSRTKRGGLRASKAEGVGRSREGSCRYAWQTKGHSGHKRCYCKAEQCNMEQGARKEVVGVEDSRTGSHNEGCDDAKWAARQQQQASGLPAAMQRHVGEPGQWSHRARAVGPASADCGRSAAVAPRAAAAPRPPPNWATVPVQGMRRTHSVLAVIRALERLVAQHLGRLGARHVGRGMLHGAALHRALVQQRLQGSHLIRAGHTGDEVGSGVVVGAGAAGRRERPGRGRNARWRGGGRGGGGAGSGSTVAAVRRCRKRSPGKASRRQGKQLAMRLFSACTAAN